MVFLKYLTVLTFLLVMTWDDKMSTWWDEVRKWQKHCDVAFGYCWSSDATSIRKQIICFWTVADLGNWNGRKQNCGWEWGLGGIMYLLNPQFREELDSYIHTCLRGRWTRAMLLKVNSTLYICVVFYALLQVSYKTSHLLSLSSPKST